MRWKERLTYPFDLYELSRVRPYLMGIATLWITFYHSKWLNLFESVFLTKTHLLPIFTRIESIGNCGVDLFFFLSGLGLYFSYTRLLEKEAHPAKTFYRRRYSRTIPTILIVTILTFGLMKEADLASWAGDVFLYGYFVPGMSRGNFWYLSATLVFYLVFPLIHKCLRGRRGGYAAAGIIVLSMAATAVVSVVFADYFYTHAILMMTRIPVFVLGAYLGKMSMEHRKIPGWVPLLAVPVSVVLLVVIADLPQVKYYRFHEFAVFVPCIALAHAYVYSKLKKPGFWCKSVMVVGTYSMEIYLLYESIYNHGRDIIDSPDAVGLVYALTAFVAALVLAVILKAVAGQLTRLYEGQGENQSGKRGE